MLNNKKMENDPTDSNDELKCWISDFEEAVYNFEGVEGDIEEEIVDVMTLLQDVLGEIEDIILLNVKKDKISDEINEWEDNCISQYDVNLSSCKYEKEQYDAYNKEFECLIEESIVLAEEVIKNMTKAKSLFDKKINSFNFIKENCYLELGDRSCSCGKGYARDLDDNIE